jgi:hypothetical protein
MYQPNAFKTPSAALLRWRIRRLVFAQARDVLGFTIARSREHVPKMTPAATRIFALSLSASLQERGYAVRVRPVDISSSDTWDEIISRVIRRITDRPVVVPVPDSSRRVPLPRKPKKPSSR